MARWDEAHAEPAFCAEFEIRLALAEPIRQVYWASPDVAQPALEPVEWSTENGMLNVRVPYLQYWALIAIEVSR